MNSSEIKKHEQQPVCQKTKKIPGTGKTKEEVVTVSGIVLQAVET
jgi:hypothetical protein